MTKIKENDFVEIEYTGKVPDLGIVFDTTDELVAKENDLYNSRTHFGPVVVCVGHGYILSGLDSHLEGKEANKEYTIRLSAEEGFGKKDGRLLKILPTNAFHRDSIKPMPGLQVNVDGMFGVIKTVTGGRSMVDFNHPLSGKELEYSVKIGRIVDADDEKVAAILRAKAGIRDAKVAISDGTVIVSVKKAIPEDAKGSLESGIREHLPQLNKVIFTIQKEEHLNSSKSSEEVKL